MSHILLGGAIGDALGKPFEKMRPNNPALLNWDGESYLASEWHGSAEGCWTDDTAFSILVAQSLISNNGFNPEALAQSYVEYVMSETNRGYGRSTKAAIQNLIDGKHWSESGIVGSWGNGTAMRAAPFAVFFRHDLKALLEAVKTDCLITHNSNEALAGSLAIALTAYYAINNDLDRVIERVCEFLPDSEILRTLQDHLIDTKWFSTTHPTDAWQNMFGVGFDVRETVPATLYAFLRFGSFAEAIVSIIEQGGDADTNASITGALLSCRDGIKNVSQTWIDGIEDRDKLMRLDRQLWNRDSERMFPRS